MTGRRALSLAAHVLFYAYVVTLAVAGIWGTFGARLDFPLLLHQEVGDLDPEGASDVLSQYRFLRAVEAGFGVFALRFRREIFTEPTFNRLFLGWMGFGILARLVSLPLDGRPSAAMLLFLAVELVGIVAVVLATWPVVVGRRSPVP